MLNRAISPAQKVFLFSELAVLALAAALVMSVARVPDLATAKVVTAALAVAAFCAAPFRLFSSGRLCLLIGLLSFPVTLTLGGKDALGGSSVLILAMTVLFGLGLAVQRRPVRLEKGIWIGALIAIAAYGVLKSPRQFWGPEARHFINFASSGLLFLMLVNWPALAREDRRGFAERVLMIIVVMACVQTLIGLLVFHWPAVGRLFGVFLVRTKEELTIEGDMAAMRRLSGLSMAIEEIGEFLALLCPLAVWLAFEKSRWFWAAFCWLWIGLLYSNTRSAVLLGAASSLVMIAVYARKMRGRDLLWLGISVAGALALGAVSYSALLEPVVRHLGVSVQEWRDDAGVMRVVNRSIAWPDAWRVVESTLSLFGNGPAPSRVLGLNEMNMHSLYLTLIYQFGIAGSLLYLALPLGILVRLADGLQKRGSYDRFPLACFLSLLALLLNEVKFEFNRGDYYQQMIWAMLAIFCLAARPNGHRADEPGLPRGEIRP